MATLQRVAEDDPNRCQAVGKYGQCPYKAVGGAKNCQRHGGMAMEGRIEREKVRNYRLTLHHARVNEFADNDQAKSLREELGILRLILERVLNLCATDADLMIYAQRIVDMVTKIERIVISCSKLERSLGQTMDKPAVLNIATRIINIISEHIEDPEILDDIVSEILKSIDEESEGPCET